MKKVAIINGKIASFAAFPPAQCRYVSATPTALLKAGGIPSSRRTRQAAKQIIAAVKSGKSKYLQLGEYLFDYSEKWDVFVPCFNLSWPGAPLAKKEEASL